MAKAKWFILAFLYLFLYATLTNALGLGGDTGFVVDPSGLMGEPTASLSFIQTIISILATMGNLVAFQTPDLPVLLVILTVYPAVLIVVFILIEYIVEILKIVAEAIPF
ncbi:MAG: hypothetical protein QXI16_03570 [Sulfolobaceae archaeon]